MNRSAARFFQGAGTRACGCACRHHIVHDQNRPILQALACSSLKCSRHVREPLAGCQMRLRFRWTQTAQCTMPAGFAQTACQRRCKQGGLIESPLSRASRIERNRTHRIELHVRKVNAQARVQPFDELVPQPKGRMVFELMNQGGRDALKSHGRARPVKGGLHLRAVKAGIDVIHTPFDRIPAPGATRITDDEEGPSAIPAQLPLICVDAHPTTGASTRIYQVK